MRRPSCFFTILKIFLLCHSSWLSISIVHSGMLPGYVSHSFYDKKDSSWCFMTVDIIYYEH